MKYKDYGIRNTVHRDPFINRDGRSYYMRKYEDHWCCVDVEDGKETIPSHFCSRTFGLFVNNANQQNYWVLVREGDKEPDYNY